MRFYPWAGGVLTLGAFAIADKASEAVDLTKVKAITLTKGKLTSHRRVDAIPQLRCIGGNARRYYEVDVMRCTNVGEAYDGLNIQWTCKADLPGEFKLGSTEVICEGYDGPDDEYVLKGSCGVEYRLVLTPQGEQRYGSGGERTVFETIMTWLTLTFIFGVFGFIIYKTCVQTRQAARDTYRAFHGGGGGGDDGDDDPPPPYNAGPGDQAKFNSHLGGQRRDGWGFWRSTAAGAAGGWAASRMGNSGYHRSGWDENRWGSSGGPWGSNGGSSSNHQSTGYGGTSRR